MTDFTYIDLLSVLACTGTFLLFVAAVLSIGAWWMKWLVAFWDD